MCRGWSVCLCCGLVWCCAAAFPSSSSKIELTRRDRGQPQRLSTRSASVRRRQPTHTRHAVDRRPSPWTEVRACPPLAEPRSPPLRPRCAHGRPSSECSRFGICLCSRPAVQYRDGVHILLHAAVCLLALARGQRQPLARRREATESPLPSEGWGSVRTEVGG